MQNQIPSAFLFSSRKMSFLCSFVVLTLSALGSLGSAQKIEQPGSITVLDGTPFNLTCTLSSATRETIQWYRQFPGQGPQYIVGAYSGQSSKSSNPKSTLYIAKDKGSTTLELDHITVGDAAVYFCALSDPSDGAKLVWGKGTVLKVNPNLEDSDPSIYELKPKDEEKKGKAACLFTDYSPNPLEVGINENEKTEVNGSVVVMEDGDSQKGTPSYGIVLWGNEDESFSCTAWDKDGQTLQSTPGDAGMCSQESDDSITFQTDERLNLLSLTVLGLRVIFLKSVAFNLLLTFRLWSR